ncbi:DUF6274 family protein [Streptomyces sp. NPDC006540]|uniref:DUF6274 family protein n=1 Tax=Streptomyces sp. NPDC006540 TaxID=3155353 RepID=UPI0033AA25B5
MAASTARRYETRALLRAHLSAASGYRHLTRSCPICHRLLRLAMERPDEEPSGTGQAQPPATRPPTEAPKGPSAEDEGPPEE